MKMLRKVLILFLFMIIIRNSEETLDEEIGNGTDHSNRLSTSLSRKRRYLTFPAGSSLQLVYCLTLPSVGVGAIFTFGLTAALAWELPSTTDELLMSFGKKPITTTTTTTEAPTTLPHHHDEEDHHDDFADNPSQRIGSQFSDGWTYKNKYPAAVKSYYDPFRLKQNFKYGNEGYSTLLKNQFSTWRKNSNNINSNRNFNSQYNYNNELDSSYIHPRFHQIHRRTRRELYGKLEKLLTALSKDGKACLQKAICEVSQIPKGKGTLFEELMKTVFRIKPHEDYPDEDEYDLAFNKKHNCIDKYPTCANSVWADMF